MGESLPEREKRYSTAKGRMALWLPLYEEAYKYAIPARGDFYGMPSKETTPTTLIDNVYDATAVEGVVTFANNMQSILMPPFRRWASLEAGDAVKEADKDQANKELQEITKTLFKHIDRSNFNLAINESLQDVAVGTGFMLIQEGTKTKPLKFQSVPIYCVTAEEGENGDLENFWRDIEIPARLIMRMWPKADITKDTELQSLITTSPDQLVKLVEGTICYPDNPPSKRYCYYVAKEGHQSEILNEWRDSSAWLAFRYSRVSGELLGRGPVLTALPFIKVLNTMSEYELRNAKFRLANAYMVAGDGVLNPFNVRIVPGAMIPVISFLGGDPIKPLPVGGDVKFMQLSIGELRQIVRALLLADPLGPADNASQSATEISLRQQNWVRQAGASFGRLTIEMLDPIIDKSVRILRRRGLIPKISIGPKVSTAYESPLAEVQNQDDLQRLQQYAGYLAPLIQNPAFAIPMKIEEIYTWAADKFGVDLDLIRTQPEAAQKVDELKQAMSKVSPQAAQGGGGAQAQPPEIPQPTMMGGMGGIDSGQQQAA